MEVSTICGGCYKEIETGQIVKVWYVEGVMTEIAHLGTVEGCLDRVVIPPTDKEYMVRIRRFDASI